MLERLTLSFPCWLLQHSYLYMYFNKISVPIKIRQNTGVRNNYLTLPASNSPPLTPFGQHMRAFEVWQTPAPILQRCSVLPQALLRASAAGISLVTPYVS